MTKRDQFIVNWSYPINRKDFELQLKGVITEAISKHEHSNLIEFANFIGNRAFPEYSKSTNKWMWWDNDIREYKYASTEELLEAFRELPESHQEGGEGKQPDRQSFGSDEGCFNCGNLNACDQCDKWSKWEAQRKSTKQIEL